MEVAPLFTSPGAGSTCSWSPVFGMGPQPCPAAYTLKSGSPALKAGTAVSGNGGVDYYGTAVPSTPNIGADAG
ncbi:hypothetical protein P3L51_25455 [Streptomyces sp. PSRA5]|uniref:hypothetical protein n=1 Tax=Streptomyces panacea TaxID=3035064 RepID=UPI00339D1C7B